MAAVGTGTWPILVTRSDRNRVAAVESFGQASTQCCQCFHESKLHKSPMKRNLLQVSLPVHNSQRVKQTAGALRCKTSSGPAPSLPRHLSPSLPGTC